jgi:hypothetical protein
MFGMKRREFLKASALGAAGLALAACNDKILNLLNDGEEKLWGMNVHPYGGPLADAQIEALRRLGIRRVRMTLGLHQDLAGSYLRRFPAEYLGLVADYDDPYPSAAAWPGLVRQAVLRSPGVTTFEILNEPAAISVRNYIDRYLKPAYDVIKGINPTYRVVAAAPNDTSGGRTDFYAMTQAGADSFCDARAAHLYASPPERYLLGTNRPFIVSETGFEDPARHVDWWKSRMTEISGVLETSEVYFYDLASSPDDTWALISSRSLPGQIQVLSPLYDYIRGKWGG